MHAHTSKLTHPPKISWFPGQAPTEQNLFVNSRVNHKCIKQGFSFKNATKLEILRKNKQVQKYRNSIVKQNKDSSVTS